jgi:hypothetical protein
VATKPILYHCRAFCISLTRRGDEDQSNSLQHVTSNMKAPDQIFPSVSIYCNDGSALIGQQKGGGYRWIRGRGKGLIPTRR